MTHGSARGLVIDLDAPSPGIDWEAVALWRLIATTGGVPCWAGWVVSPGRVDDPSAYLERVLIDAREVAAEYELAARVAGRFGLRPPAPPRQSVSVVVCTRRRSVYLPGLLGALGQLDPAPDEIVVVDNDPGDQPCRELVEAHGARYVREDRRGLDHARTAGLAAAIGTVVAFTDDDCVPPRGWLANVDRHFGHPDVDALTAPAFAYELETPAQLRFELSGGFNRGFAVRRHDWTTIAPAASGSVGAGANMMFRRDRLLALGDVFPPELDAGTIAETGGDLWALYMVLAGGGRLIYDPACYTFHRHRRDPDALHRTFLSYGTGIVAAVCKLVVERREPEALLLLRWVWSQYRHALQRRMIGQLDPRSLRVSADYLVGAVTGVSRWSQSLAAERAADLRLAPPVLPAAPTTKPGCGDADGARLAHPGPEGAPAVTIIIPTIGREAVLSRCLDALPTSAPGVEVLVVDDRPGPPAPLAVADRPQVRRLRSGGVGAAAARNLGAARARGELLVFLDDDLIAQEGLIDRHLAAHAETADAFVLGQSLPAAVDGWAARRAALWWHDHFRHLAAARHLTPTDMLSGNVSIDRRRFEELGCFPAQIGRMRREDWLFGAAVLRAGLVVRYEPAALARHEFTMTTAGCLDVSAQEGWGDAVLIRAEPEFARALGPPPCGRRAIKVRLAAGLLLHPRARGAVVAGLNALERLRLRGGWLACVSRLQRLAYLNGRLDGARELGTPEPTVRPSHAVDLEELDTWDEPDGLFAPDVRVTADGPPRVVHGSLGRWTEDAARLVARYAASAGMLRPSPPPADPARMTTRVAVVAPRSAAGEAARASCEASGLVLHLVDDADVTLWAEAERLLASGGVDLAWVVLPRVELPDDVGPELLTVSDGDRVAVTLLIPGTRTERDLFDSAMDSSDRIVRTAPPALLGVRRDALEHNGGLDPAAAGTGGILAPGLGLIRGAVRAGQVLGFGTLRGARRVYPVRRPWRTAEWAWLRAHGAWIASQPASRAAVAAIQTAVAVALLGVSPARPVRGRLTALGGFAQGLAAGRAHRTR